MAQSADSLLKAGMKTNKPRRIKKGEPGYGKKKFVVVASSSGKKKVIRFGDANMAIRRDNPKARKNFRSRHGCDTAAGKNKLTAKYWSCYQWRAGSKVKG
tara:strand:+ start:450 stop:749 length:300 start_codon:yes stop_codon:yes gene_type:complete